jgi:ABC-type multidrug transport system fused ATPase/permease subunit
MSKDVESIDQQLWLFLFLVIISCTGLLGIVVLLIYVIYPMIALFVPLVVLYFFILKYYQRTFRELKRLDSVERSPLYAHLSESLQGLSTIRAFKVTDRFVEKQRKLMDLSNIPAYLKLTAAIWVNIRIELIGTTVTLLLILLGVSSTISPSSIGLGLTYAIALCGNINLLLIASSQLDSEMNAVERLDTYVNLPQQEAARELPNDPDEHWPTKGSISIQNLELRYSTGDQRPVIRDLTMEIKPGEKVGIVGRTGSGKSTLLLALFRIIEPVKGTIHIDGLDICGMGLKRLRTGMQIIAQEPVLFTGTIRSNLDVESEFQDSDIWDVLEMIGMKEFVTSQSLQLEALVTENGENLSVGQRQLLTLGRAILKKPRILILDEATASVDTRADNLIQQSIKTHFAESTVISIAHRLNTIIDFDRVLVLDNGQKVEYDSPMALLQNKNSSFFKLAEATGQSNLARLQEASKKV